MEMKREADRLNGGTTQQMKNWKPIHTSIVMDYAAGKSVDALSEKYGYAFTTIANIVRSSQAKRILKAVEQKVLAEGVDSLPEQVKQLKVLAFNRVATFLKDDNLAEKSPFAFFDRSVKALDTLSKMDLPAHSPVQTQQNTSVQMNFFTNPENLNTLTAGLDRALEVSKNYDALPAETVDGSTRQFERIKSSREASEGVG